MNEVGKVIKDSKVLIMGLTYKENVPDTRESPVREMVKELKEFGVDVYGYDPLLSKEEIEDFGVKTLDFSFSTGFLFSKKKKCKVDCVIVAVAHDEFKNKSFLSTGSFFRKKVLNDKPVLVDVRGMFDGEEAEWGWGPVIEGYEP
ncbi:MAG: UDP binding domain-containing protein [Methanophagales archaeon]|nr:UDP binding domain-containing protein [Methanophagales archaeon]